MKLSSILLIAVAFLTGCVAIPPAGYPGNSPEPSQRPVPQPTYDGGEVKPAPVYQAARPSKPSLQRLPNGHYRVLADWPVRVSGRNFLVQKGYTSNGITAPKSIKSFLGDHVNAPETWTAVFHDWCFTQKGLSREQCDNYYIQLMRDFRISPQKISLMGTTVKGYSIYKGN